MRANSIDEVITCMDDFIGDCLAEHNRLGYFAWIYYTTTKVVKERCDDGFFEDNDRMRYLDVVFAQRYFDALVAYHKHQGVLTQSWEVSFELGKSDRLLILQHILLGMNAHISLDLGISTAEAADGKLTPSLKRDFDRLNNILAGMIGMVQDELSKVSPLLSYLNRLAWRADEAFIAYSIKAARDSAWRFAEELNALPREEWDDAIARKDAAVANLSRRVIGSTQWYVRPVIWVVQSLEEKDPNRVLEVLNDADWSSFLRSRVEALLEIAEQEGIDLTKRKTQTIRIPKELIMEKLAKSKQSQANQQ